MPTNEERREVSSKLRDIEFKNHFFSPWCKAVETILNGKDCGEDDGTFNEDECCKRFLKEIADLIEPEPERTCFVQYEYTGKPFFHSIHVHELSCGHDVRLYEDAPIYCPYCGAKVV